MTTLYIVTYFIYNDTDTIHTFVFDNKIEADIFESYLENRCEDKNIPIEINTTISTVTSSDDAISAFNEQTYDEDEKA